MSTSIYFKDLTKAEKEALKQMDKAMKVLSKRHWFYAAGSGDLNIMRVTENEGMTERGGVDPEYVSAKITGFHVDGGDW